MNVETNIPTPPPGDTIVLPTFPEVSPATAIVEPSVLTLSGLRLEIMRRRVEHAKGLVRSLPGDYDTHRHTAEDTLTKYDSVVAYDPMKSFNSTHRKGRRPGVDAMPAPVEIPRTNSRTKIQEFATMRTNLRLDAIHRRKHRINTLVDLHGEILHDKNAVEAELDSGRYSRGQKKAIKADSRQVRKYDRSINRLHGRIERSADGRDIHGVLIGARGYRAQNKIGQLTPRIERLEQEVARKNVRRAERKIRRSEIRQAVAATSKRTAKKAIEQGGKALTATGALVHHPEREAHRYVDEPDDGNHE